ncbi:hypothetical protein [Providencia sp. wls1922]|uniref:hypothetical protein n=1 Tax=Providencia sp. wls1922 TaxID=2675152 RepID=UPI001E4606B6
MMRSEAKKIYGVDVLGMIAILKHIRKLLVIRKLRRQWGDYRRDLIICRKFSHLSHLADYFQVQQRYTRIRLYTKAHQQRGTI